MHGAVHERAGGAAAQQFIEEELGDVGGVFRVLEAALGRERVLLEPRQQPRRRRRDHVRLRIVDVRVDEARRDDLVAQVFDRRAGRQRRRDLSVVAHGDDAAVLERDDAVGVVHRARRAVEIGARGIVREVDQLRAYRVNGARAGLGLMCGGHVLGPSVVTFA